MQPPMRYASILDLFADTGLLVRGGFAAGTDDDLPQAPSGAPAAAVVLVGNEGAALWPAFSAARRDEPDPLDRWTERTVAPLAARLGARAVYPNDRPYHPFQQWAMRAEPVATSPIGLLVHPDYGLWHAYRAALLFDRVPEGLPARADRPSPCADCADRPCLNACPVGSHSTTGFHLPSCERHLRAGHDRACMELGCRSRDGCPVGRASRFPPEQLRFHMAAFLRSRA